MLNFGMIEDRIEETLELYFQQCSVMMNCRDLAVMAATLANGGVNPMTGQAALEPCYVKDLLSIMLSCGMYDYAGEWAYRTGLPAKSGVSGGSSPWYPESPASASSLPPRREGEQRPGRPRVSGALRHLRTSCLRVRPQREVFARRDLPEETKRLKVSRSGLSASV